MNDIRPILAISRQQKQIKHITTGNMGGQPNKQLAI